MLTRRDYCNAIDSQNACNLSGIVRTFAEVTDRIWAEARSCKQGTEYVNRHPISRLYAEQILFLAGGGAGDASTYWDAHAECKRNLANFDITPGCIGPAVRPQALEVEEAELGCPVG
jgi:hypothetical protein